MGQLSPIAPTTLGMLLLLEAKSHLSSRGSWGLGDTGPVHPTVSWPRGHDDPTSASFTSPPRPSFFLQLPASLPFSAADSYPADFQWHVHSQAEFSCLHQDPRYLTVPNIAQTFWKRVGNYKPLFPKDFLLWRSCMCVCVCVCVCVNCSVVSDSFVIPGTVARQALLSLAFFRQEYWSRLPFPSPGDLPDPGMEATSLMALVLAGRFFTM